jgi:hypothetical protein
MKRGRRPKANPSKWGLYKRIKRREEKQAMQSWLETLQRQEEIKREHQRPF